MDIVSRPSLLQQISTIWLSPELQRYKHNITSALVIKLFIESAFRRQVEKARRDETFRFMRLNQAELSCFTTGIALVMAREQLPNQISGPDLHRAVEKLLSVMPDDFNLPARPDLGEQHGPLKERLSDVQNLLEAVVTNVRSYGILVRDYAGPDLFRFAHKCYYELLTATHAADVLTKKSTNITSLFEQAFGIPISRLFVSPPSLRFCGELLATMKDWPSHDFERLRALYKAICVNRWARVMPIWIHLNGCYLLHVMSKKTSLLLSAPGLMVITLLIATMVYSLKEQLTKLFPQTDTYENSLSLAYSVVLLFLILQYHSFLRRLHDRRTRLLFYCQIGEAMVGHNVLCEFLGSTKWSVLRRFLEEPSPSP